MSQCNCAECLQSNSKDYPYESAMENELMRSLEQRIAESFRMDILIVAEQISKSQIRSSTGDKWLRILTGFLCSFQPGKSIPKLLVEIECDLFFESGLTPPLHGGTPFAISNSKG